MDWLNMPVCNSYIKRLSWIQWKLNLQLSQNCNNKVQLLPQFWFEHLSHHFIQPWPSTLTLMHVLLVHKFMTPADWPFGCCWVVEASVVPLWKYPNFTVRLTLPWQILLLWLLCDTWSRHPFCLFQLNLLSKRYMLKKRTNDCYLFTDYFNIHDCVDIFRICNYKTDVILHCINY